MREQIYRILMQHFDGEAYHTAFTLSIFLCISYLFIMVDLVTGVIAQLHLGHKLASIKWGVTVNKFLALAMYSMFAMMIVLFVANDSWLNWVLFAPIIFAILREYISIGENMATRFNGKKPYIFTLLDKVFGILEKSFIQAIERKLNRMSSEQNTCHDEDVVERHTEDNGGENGKGIAEEP